MEETEHRPSQDLDGINLMECFQVIWKRKFLIIGIFLAAVLAAAVISYNLPPVYRVTASVAPGWIDTDPSGRAIYIDTPDNIKAMIEDGTFNQKIIANLKLDPVLYSGMEFKTKLARNTEGLSVFYDTKDIEKGMLILSELIKEITGYYKIRTETRSASLDIAIEMMKNQNIINENKKARIVNDKSRIVNDKSKIISDIELVKDKEKLLKTTEKYLMKQLTEVEENTKVIMNERSDVLKKAEKTDSVALLLYSNTVQQNISYTNTLNANLDRNRLEQDSTKNELSRLGLELKNKDTELKNKDTELKDVDTDVMNNLEKINDLELKKERIEGFRVIQKPYSSTKPVLPRKKLNVAVAGMTSLFFGILLVFLLEFIQKQRNSSMSQPVSKTEKIL